MHIVANIILIFLFLSIIFFFRFPNLNNGRLITHKFIIFITLFCFQFIILTLNKIRNKCVVDVQEIAYDSLTVAVSGVVGYSLYNDINYGGVTIRYFRLDTTNPRMVYLNVSIIITLFIAFIKIIKLMINSNSNGCKKYINNIYNV